MIYRKTIYPFIVVISTLVYLNFTSLNVYAVETTKIKTCKECLETYVKCATKHLNDEKAVEQCELDYRACFFKLKCYAEGR